MATSSPSVKRTTSSATSVSGATRPPQAADHAVPGIDSMELAHEQLSAALEASQIENRTLRESLRVARLALERPP